MIVVECNADEKLVCALGAEPRQVRHQRSKGRVLNFLRKCDTSIGVIGVIDEDPDSSQPHELKQYVRREESGQFRGLCKLTHRREPSKKIILIRPRLENWLYCRAKENEIDPQAFRLPADAKTLHETPRYYEKPGFADFLSELCKKDPEARKLAEWLCE